MEVRQVWRQAHLKQPLGSRDGSRTRQRGGSGPKSTTGGSRGGSSGMARAGGVLHQITSKGPHIPVNFLERSFLRDLHRSFCLSRSVRLA